MVNMNKKIEEMERIVRSNTHLAISSTAQYRRG